MKIMKTMKKIPGGMMVVPLLLGAIINTLFPKALMIGGFTTPLFKQSAMAFIALFALSSSAQIKLKQAGLPLSKGIALTFVKFVIGVLLGIIVGKIFGNHGILGLTPLAIVAAVTNSNGGLYAALAGEYGDATDVGAISILSLNDGPFFTMVALGASGLANIPLLAFIAVLIPICLGFILGNLDSDWRKFLEPGQSLLIPFFAFPLGASLDFKTILQAGLPGIILGLSTVIFTGLAGYYTYTLFGGKKAVGAAIGTTAGNAVATPAAVAAVDPSVSAIVGPATAQIAASVIITAILCPLLVSYLDKKSKKTIDKKEIA
ncbi:2-keto-3-deoxygluconate permease [Thermoanaerobacterium thermosaccharolyticum]|uniref:2-keto-3-deoxygluconate permease n=1 Tax=Thermoanaerobacterium thermosaccharolyticum TaxID=1517 RepID=UPI0017873121|nr:2-keto-3-deoxygluconate permease [Thermoanaerobacterium thermosaccharolyticum]MBE0069325.1 2-keto-3-deoxygluconate permease [Thermoanaerobacterium thermosaccharolyticum]MBE0229105.1 2-keto-3-deoxygluconate permease [Thermoanaerobacterium thermosaccharolyticum]